MSDAHTEHTSHVISNKVLNTTFAVLFVLMVLTIFAARVPFEIADALPGMKPWIHSNYQAWWGLTNFIAIGIAVTKTIFVIQNFMGVKYASNLVRLWAIAGFVGFGLMFIAFFDYVGRPWEPVRGWEKTGSTSFPRDRDNDAGVPYKQYPGSEEGGTEKQGE